MFLYYSLVALALCLAGPVLMLSAKRRAGLGQKLGVVPLSIRNHASDGRAIWFHAVSVGEFNAVWPLVRAFAARHPQYRIYISTTTATGQQLAGERASDLAHVFYFPLDLPWALNAWMDAVRPVLAVVVETEIWPGFTHECSKRDIRLVVVNGRISPRSFGSYHRLRHFFGPVIRQFAAIAAQSKGDAQRYLAITDQANVTVTGNLKFDGLKPISKPEQEEVRSRLHLAPNQIVVVGGSTHEGEESALLAAFRKLTAALASDANQAGKAPPRLILAPRHPERFVRVADLISEMGFRPRRYSAGETFEQESDVFLLDTIGQLFRYYSVATVAFVGGTLAPIGGHNILEPYAFGVPVACGPSLEKTLDTANGLRDRQAIRIVSNSDELADNLIELIRSDEMRRELGERGRQWLSESQGAVDRTLRILESFLRPPYNDEHPESISAQAEGAKQT